MSVTSTLLYILQPLNHSAIESVQVTGATAGSPTNLTPNDPLGNQFFRNVIADAADGVYFTYKNLNGVDSFYEEPFGAAPQFATPKFTFSDPNNFSISMALDATDHILYFTDNTGLFEENFGSSFANTPTRTQIATFSAPISSMVFDQADHTIYALELSSSATGTQQIHVTNNILYKVTGVTKNATASTTHVTNALGTNVQFPWQSDGAANTLALDTADDTLYIGTVATAPGGKFGLYADPLSGPNAGTISTVFQQTQTASNIALEPVLLTVDSATGEYYISNGGNDIYAGSVSSHSAPTLLLTTTGPIAALNIIDPPTVSSAAVTAIDGNTGKTTGTVTTADAVTISVSFNEKVFITGTPTLTLNDGGSAIYVTGSGSGALQFNYHPTSGQNTTTLATTGTLTGGAITDSAATPADLTNVAQSFTGLSVQTTAPTLTVTGVTGDVVQGAATATTLLQSDSITDTNGPGTIAKAIVTIAGAKPGDQLSIPGVSAGTLDGGKVTVTGLGTSTLTLSGVDTQAEYLTLLKSVTYQDTGADTATSGHPTRTINWTVDDGVLSSAAATSTVTIDRAPTIGAGATATFTGGQASPVALDSGLTVTDLDQSNIAGAKVTIASGFLAGDTLNFTNQNGIAGTVSGATLTLSGAASAAQYQAALDSVAYSFTPSFNDPTGGGADTSRTLNWTVDDGLVNSPVATSTLNVIHAPPTLTAGGTVNYSEIGPALLADPTLTVSDPDSGGLLQSATVQIASGFAAGDALSVDLTGTPNISVVSNANGTLTLSGSDTVADYQAALRSVTFASTAPEASTTSRTLAWSVNDGVAASAAGQTSIVNVAPCYVRGTRILTERGEVAVEDLRVGDLAITAAGARRSIVWLGHRRLDLLRHPRPFAVQPVRVAAGAFGDNVPRRDLWLSPGHSVLCDGALAPISSLINGVSVAQINRDRVEYWHVELDAHDLLIAEGLAAESYLDCGNREAFDNGGGFIEAHPDFQPKHWAETCLPLVKQGPQVQAVRAQMIARLFEQGYALDAQDGAHVLVDGARIEPVRMGERRLAFALPAGGAEMALASNTFVPAHALADGDDWRELGICVGRLQVDGDTVSLEAGEVVASGWHAAEFTHGRFARRWTRGLAPLPAGARFVIVDLADIGQYWRAPVGENAAMAEQRQAL